VIFYTLQGPHHQLEIHEDKIKLISRGISKMFSKGPEEVTWNLNQLKQFEISTPKTLIWGELQWQTFDGKKGQFTFSTNTIMVKKIETYLKKRIIKNHHLHIDAA